jgi:hypothetical protein
VPEPATFGPGDQVGVPVLPPLLEVAAPVATARFLPQPRRRDDRSGDGDQIGRFPGVARRATGQVGPSAGSSVPVVTEARVNAACLRVINEAQDVYRIISGLGEAANDVDLQRLDDIVRRLQPIEPRLARDLQECRVDTQLAGDPSAAPSTPPPTVPQPSNSATR